MKKSSLEFQEAGLDFHYGILAVEDNGEKITLITPEGDRLHLNSRFNRAPLFHLHQQAVRTLLRKNPWPKLTTNWEKYQYDVLYIEALSEPLTQDELNTPVELSDLTSAEEVRALIYAS